MYPGRWAAKHPDRPAVIMADTEAVLTYGELEDRSLRLANHLRSTGLQKGDHIAVMAENRFEIIEALWAALRTGTIITVVNSHLTAAESAYIVDDCDARVFLLSTRLEKSSEVAAQCRQVENRIRIDAVPDGEAGEDFTGWDEYEAVLEAASADKPEIEPRGDDMLYSSGTTGRPKGILPGATDLLIGIAHQPVPSPLRLRRRHGLPLSCTALPCCTAAVRDDDELTGRHGRRHVLLRRRGKLGPHRKAPCHALPVGPHDVRPDAQTARGRAPRL